MLLNYINWSYISLWAKTKCQKTVNSKWYRVAMTFHGNLIIHGCAWMFHVFKLFSLLLCDVIYSTVNESKPGFREFERFSEPLTYNVHSNEYGCKNIMEKRWKTTIRPSYGILKDNILYIVNSISSTILHNDWIRYRRCNLSICVMINCAIIRWLARANMKCFWIQQVKIKEKEKWFKLHK